ncbi:hypothetical protein ACHHYP_00845 [Achlya hypogyna]|uniref:Uncharacterized protein n=1 Tax=Achlya hypogyna TaxID=1202772 RepID=A0A1V9ZA64_ACHHY|nr:hypothetical protein ACHHYP_00845 [Achlya hypogyna]
MLPTSAPGSAATDCVHLHVDGDISPQEDALLKDFLATKRVLGHTTGRDEATQVVWVLANDGGNEDKLEARFQGLAGDAARCVDMVYLHPNVPYSQQLFDKLLQLPWHPKAYCMDVCRGDDARLAQALALLLSVPAQRVAQAAAEALLVG